MNNKNPLSLLEGNIDTDRLYLSPLTIDDTPFVMELTNMPEWIQFIGKRNTNRAIETQGYIQIIIEDPNIQYWVVRLKEGQTSIGVITFIKRDYLEHHDIGFAFLSRYAKKGYAFEAATGVIRAARPSHERILATTLPDNIHSIHLLEKLGFKHEQTLQVKADNLLVYGCSL